MSTADHPGNGWPRTIPEGGGKGGEIVAVGTAEQVVKKERSYTGHYLRPLLERADGSTQGLAARWRLRRRASLAGGA